VLVLGPDSALVALTLGVVLPLSGGDPKRAIALAAMLALVSGTLCVLAGIARLGFITELLSKPIRYGYMNGIALTILVSQLPALFGFAAGGDSLLDETRAFVAGLAGDKVNRVALALGAGHARGDPGHEALAPGAGGADRGRRGGGNGVCARPRHARRACRCSARCRRACPRSPGRRSAPATSARCWRRGSPPR
jgi:hypothetical protein